MIFNELMKFRFYIFATAFVIFMVLNILQEEYLTATINFVLAVAVFGAEYLNNMLESKNEKK